MHTCIVEEGNENYRKWLIWNISVILISTISSRKSMLLSDAVNRDGFVWTHLSHIIHLSKIFYSQRNDILIVININCFDIRYFEMAWLFSPSTIIFYRYSHNHIPKVKAIPCLINDLFEVVTCLLSKIPFFENSRKSNSSIHIYDRWIAVIF